MKEEIKKYQHSVSFLRDFTHYVIPGTIFLAIAYFIFPYSLNKQFIESTTNFYNIEGTFLNISLIVVFAYFFGKLGNSFTTPIFRLFDKLLENSKNKSLPKIIMKSIPISTKRYHWALKMRNDLAKKSYIASKVKYFKDNEPLKIRLGWNLLYNKVIEYDQFMFSIRIERYNNITMFCRSVVGLSLIISLLCLFFNSHFNKFVISLFSILIAVIFYLIWQASETTRLIAMLSLLELIPNNTFYTKEN